MYLVALSCREKLAAFMGNDWGLWLPRLILKTDSKSSPSSFEWEGSSMPKWDDNGEKAWIRGKTHKHKPNTAAQCMPTCAELLYFCKHTRRGHFCYHLYSPMSSTLARQFYCSAIHKALLQHVAFRIAIRERELSLLLHPNLKNERLRPCSVPLATTYGVICIDQSDWYNTFLILYCQKSVILIWLVNKYSISK